jgi:hypothetical protein
MVRDLKVGVHLRLLATTMGSITGIQRTFAGSINLIFFGWNELLSNGALVYFKGFLAA